MAVQSAVLALQNASNHTAAVFRQAGFSPFLGGGVLAATEYAVTAQSTPNMSVQVAGGRAWIPGTQVASVSGQSFTTQGAYFALNDAPVTATIAAANATNPRIDVVYVAVNDAFYSGATNNAVIGVVTGTAAASPVAPAAPANSLTLATVAVAANATSITNSNITQTPPGSLLTVARGGIDPVSATDVTAGAYVDQYRGHPTNGIERWDGSKWSTPTPIEQWTDQTSTTYAYTMTTTGGTALPTIQSGAQAQFTVTVPAGRTLEVELHLPKVQMAASAGAFLRLVDSGSAGVIDGVELSAGTSSMYVPVLLRGSLLGDGTTRTVTAQGWSSVAQVIVSASSAAAAPVRLRYRIL